MSQRDTMEIQFGHRDRGRMRRHDRGPGRPRSSRSRSPKAKSQNQQFRRNSTDRETSILSACPICLSRKKHRLQECQATSLRDGQNKARCTRANNGRIIDSNGRVLCSNWNQTIRCKDRSSHHIHECSGCGESSHGAQQCGLAEKTRTTDSAHL